MAVTQPGPIWKPRREADLQTAITDNLLEESHYLDLKRTIDPGKSANKKIACDIAAFALDGGTIIVGIDEGDAAGTPTLWPIELSGLSERVESIAATAVHEPVRITTTRIESAAKPGHGYLVVHVPQSARAPHMVDGRYYGRGDKENRVLSQEEVLRLHERRLAGRKDMIAETRSAIAELGPLPGRDSIFALLAVPVGAPDDMLVALTDSDAWQVDVLELVNAATTPQHRRYSPSLPDARGFARRANGVAITTGIQDGRWAEGRGAEIAFHESGSLFLASQRAVETLTFPNVNPQPPAADVIFEQLILGHTDMLVRVAAGVAQKYGFTGTWRFGLVITGLRGTRSWALAERRFRPEGGPYTARDYERATDATLLDLTQEPRRIVNVLVAPLLRSIESHRLWEGFFAEPADIASRP